MEADQSEYSATKETLSESQRMAEELGISLTDTLLLRQLVQLRWLCQTKTNELPFSKHSPSN
jgi:hypothetical protein